MPSPGNVDQHHFANLIGRFKQFRRRHMIRANCIHLVRTHLIKIGSQPGSHRKLQSLRVGSKRAISDPLNSQSVITTREELAVHAHPHSDRTGH